MRRKWKPDELADGMKGLDPIWDCLEYGILPSGWVRALTP